MIYSPIRSSCDRLLQVAMPLPWLPFGFRKYVKNIENITNMALCGLEIICISIKEPFRDWIMASTLHPFAFCLINEIWKYKGKCLFCGSQNLCNEVYIAIGSDSSDIYMHNNPAPLQCSDTILRCHLSQLQITHALGQCSALLWLSIVISLHRDCRLRCCDCNNHRISPDSHY